MLFRSCTTCFNVALAEHETQLFVTGLGLGLSVAGAVAFACPPCAPIAGAVVVGLGVSAASVAFDRGTRRGRGGQIV